MKKWLFFGFLASVLASCENTFFTSKEGFVTRFETSNGTESAAYEEVIDFYKELSRQYSTISLKTMGQTDAGLPLHIVTYNADAEFNFSKLQKEKTILLINNGIHPGETDGIDATMLLFRNLVQNQIKVPDNVVIVAVPVYNIGGALNRNSTSRVNQNGPKEYGFRGNAQNLDLNRDFIKNDSENALSFAKIFRLVQPDVFIDNHVTNGADYQHSLTYAVSQPDKAGSFIGNYTRESLLPRLSDSLVKRQNEFKSDSLPKPFWKLVPYVNVWNRPPDAGYNATMDSPRYSTGYVNLWNCIGILIETHMLKPYKQRVEANYEMMKSLVEILDSDSKNIKELKIKQFEEDLAKSDFPIQWRIDSTQVSSITFHGYKADTLISEVTGLTRLRYDQTKPFVKEIPFYERFLPQKSVKVPTTYIVPKVWKNVVERLKINGVEMSEIEKDTLMLVSYYRIEDYKTTEKPFEGHYLHFDTQVSKHQDYVQLYKGDFIVAANQTAKRYLIETLEPEAVDSFFNWNFFDSVLQQKEHFSPYLFEDIALEFLHKNPHLKDSLDLMKKRDKAFADSSYQQLNWIYRQTPHYEKSHLRYPIYFIE
ncbi:M14 family metallopeptidase [Capnocytophaga sp.]|uniref:M14 family metallopeptidase n=1 Tax=Capnocytophaga sp. TaxID=44737 RepID=UPI0026DC571A|nr:M14 family metallopeptidase [Capnocytophaga sp.]MDO5105133.1 M14 family metallopeptidase [Capnocytophaga sp.]